jgi:predicted lactoylglutathione lyase
MAASPTVRSVFINLPVGDVGRAQAFFEGLGFSADPRFSAEDRAACITLGPEMSLMLLNRQVFAAMSPKPVANTATVAGVLNCLRLGSREEIDRIMEAALAAGGTEPRPQREQQGTYGRAFEDPDGHVWELLWIEGE